MTKHMTNTPKHLARWAGFLYLVLIPIGFFAVTYVPSLLVPEDMAATVSNIAASKSMFRLSMVATFLMNIIAIAIVLLLYRLLKQLGKNMVVFMVVFLLIGSGISMLNELNYFAVLALSSAEALTVFTAEQSQYLVNLFLDMCEYGSYIAAIYWGLWLFPLGYLIYTLNSTISKMLGILLIVAGVAYVIDSFALFLMPQYGISLADFAFVGEVLFPLWLLIKGEDVEKLIMCALESD